MSRFLSFFLSLELSAVHAEWWNKSNVSFWRQTKRRRKATTRVFSEKRNSGSYSLQFSLQPLILKPSILSFCSSIVRLPDRTSSIKTYKEHMLFIQLLRNTALIVIMLTARNQKQSYAWKSWSWNNHLFTLIATLGVKTSSFIKRQGLSTPWSSHAP